MNPPWSPPTTPATAAAAVAAAAETGTFIRDRQSQSGGPAKMDLKLDLTKIKPDPPRGPANHSNLTVEEMEAELASIEAQRRSVLLARRWAAAKEDQARGFPVVGTIPVAAASRPTDSAREESIRKDEAQPFVPKISTYKEVFRSYKDIRQCSGESVDSVVGRINALEQQMPPQPEQSRVHTLLFALHLATQDVILKRQSGFATRNELQKLAVELEALEKKQQKLRDLGGRIEDGAGSWGTRSNGQNGLNYIRGGSHAPSRVSKGIGKSPVTGAKRAMPRRERRGRDKDLSHVACYNCGHHGHFATSCPEPKRGDHFKQGVGLLDVRSRP
ncbi:hypothetical protein MMC07_005385 [Pseudocyphellaria aurata]|nr:hypothetical protein [Pseudocyphellaria aurata]